MTLRIHTGVLAAGAAALISAQAVYAAPTTITAVDPLVSLSALGTAQSRAALCAAGTTAAAMAGAAAAQSAPAGCVLPVNPQVAPVAQVAPPPYVAPAVAAPGKRIGWLPILGGLALLAIVAALALNEDDDDDGDLTPISPA